MGTAGAQTNQLMQQLGGVPEEEQEQGDVATDAEAQEQQQQPCVVEFVTVSGTTTLHDQHGEAFTAYALHVSCSNGRSWKAGH